MTSIYLENEAATEAFGAALATLMPNGLVTLSGNLGAGKTTLTRGLIHSLGHTGAVKSPTYTLVEPYELDGRRVMHFDLYRMEDPEELEYIGFRDYLDASTLCLVEWPQKALNYLPEPDLAIDMQLKKKGREISWQAFSTKGEAASEELQTVFK